MKRPPSLRRRLIVSLLAVFVTAWLIMLAVTYEETRHEVEELFDAQLAQVAGLFSERAAHGTADLQDSAAQVLSQGVYGHKYERLVGFQIWQGERLQLRSQSAPPTPLARVDGYSDTQLDGERWRVFAFNAEDGRRVFAGESYAVRDELTHDIALATMVPLLWAVPFLAALVWVAVGRGLRPLRRVASEVAGRDQRRLEPLPEEGVPEELQALVRSLNELLARLGEAFDRERRFTADAAHELRTPLAGLKVQAQAALASSDTEARDHAVAGIVAGVDRATRLVEQLLDMARVDPQVLAGEPQAVPLAALAEEVLADLFPVARQHEVELAFEPASAGAADLVVAGDRAGLYALLRNLVENALRHSPRAGQVTVTLTVVNGAPCLAVIDQGPGIPAAEREQVFRRFYRGAGSRGEAGAGLGLAIVRRLAELHHAEVRLGDAPPPGGLRVEVRFIGEVPG